MYLSSELFIYNFCFFPPYLHISFKDFGCFYWDFEKKIVSRLSFQLLLIETQMGVGDAYVTNWGRAISYPTCDSKTTVTKVRNEIKCVVFKKKQYQVLQQKVLSDPKPKDFFDSEIYSLKIEFLKLF